MIGAIIGDIAGSRFEFHNQKTKDFELFHPDCRFTDDSVMTLAVASALMDWRAQQEGPGTGAGGPGAGAQLEGSRAGVQAEASGGVEARTGADGFQDSPGAGDQLSGFGSPGGPVELETLFVRHMQSLGRAYPKAGYGGRFYEWIFRKSPQPYNSWGNGSAMRVSPCGEFARSLGEAASLAKRSASVTHDHPEGIKGAESVAAAIFLAQGGRSKEEIRQFIDRYYYPMDFTLDEIRPAYRFDVSCQGSVPQALQSFFESTNFEDTIRNAISLGGDSDTIAAIAGGIAESYYGVDPAMQEKAMTYLPPRLQEIVCRWYG